MKFGLSNTSIEKITSVFARHPEIVEAVIYGSRAKGNYREGSDIDISLFGKNLTNELLSKVWLEIDELNTPYLFDISIFDKLTSEGLKEHILRAGKMFYIRSEKEMIG